jgi:hypothetical protein
MSLLVRHRVLGQLDKVHYEGQLALRVEQGKEPYETRIYPHGTDEPALVRFRGRVGVKSSSEMIEGAAEIVVTRLRLIMLVKSGMNARGLNQKAGEVAIVSVDRTDLGSPQVINTRSGKIKRVEFAGSTESFAIQVLYHRSFESFLKTMVPEYAQQLGYENAVRVNEAKRMDDARAAARLVDVEQKQCGGGDQQQQSPVVASGVRLLAKLMNSGAGRLGLVGACAAIGTSLILAGNHIQGHYVAEQARCSEIVRQSAGCVFGNVATTIGGSIAKTGWVALFLPAVIVITSLIIIRKKKPKVIPVQPISGLASSRRKPSEPDESIDRGH